MYEKNSSIYHDHGGLQDDHDGIINENNYSVEEELLEDELDDEFIENEPFSLPTYAKPLPLLGHPSRHSVLNRYYYLLAYTLYD